MNMNTAIDCRRCRVPRRKKECKVYISSPLPHPLRDMALVIDKMMQQGGTDLQGRGGHKPSQFLLEHGFAFPCTHTSFTRAGIPKECYRNAFLGAQRWEGVYCEGQCFVHGVPIDHAWLVDARGVVIDPTLRLELEDDLPHYLGVPMQWEYVLRVAVRRGHYGALGNYQDGHPLYAGKVSREDFLHPDYL